MNTFIHTAVINEALVESCDTKLAIWTSLLPSCKKDPLRANGEVDEIMYVEEIRVVSLECLLIIFFPQVHGAYGYRHVSVHSPLSEMTLT